MMALQLTDAQAKLEGAQDEAGKAQAAKIKEALDQIAALKTAYALLASCLLPVCLLCAHACFVCLSCSVAEGGSGTGSGGSDCGNCVGKKKILEWFDEAYANATDILLADRTGRIDYASALGRPEGDTIVVSSR
jgi:hypothetical protein